MHPAFMAWGCAPRGHHACHPHHAWHRRKHHQEGTAEEMDDDPLGGGFGVRRPLRFLAHKLDLDDRQVTELARILDELKTERAQAEVDRRRSLTAFADALTTEAFDTSKAAEGGQLRVKSAERLREAVVKSLQQIHALLSPEQRSRLAYLIRTGTLAV